MAFRAGSIREAKIGARRETRVQAAQVRPKEPSSPYFGLHIDEVAETTMLLLDAHPLSPDHIVDAVLGAWEGIANSTIGHQQLRIGVHILPAPQVMGFFLHEIIPYELAALTDGWSVGVGSRQKDLVCLENDAFSIEIKTSSDPRRIFGNRSYGQQNSNGKKAKDGYYLAVNFESWSDSANPQIAMIRWGWLDHTDWVSQIAQTGQQSSLPASVENRQLLCLYEG